MAQRAPYGDSPSQEDSSPLDIKAVSKQAEDVASGPELTEIIEDLEESAIDMLKDALREEAPSKDDSFVIAVSICNAAQRGDLERLRAILED